MIDFKAPYAREHALSFLSRFLPEDFKKIVEENIPLNFKPQFIELVNKLGETGSLQDLHIYEIVHGSENDPRVGISRDVFRLLTNFGVRKALIFFVSRKSPNYRLSLVTLDLKWESGKKVEREYSNPRRYSFFLGPDAKTHTPAQFLITKGAIKDVEDLISRFDVEVVTKEFFTNYKKLFDNLQKFLEKDRAFTEFAEKNSIDIDSFAKKILGQIVFCYFLQKKGWLGALKGQDINKGDKDFMRSLFNKSAESGKNFYNDCLECLFYDSLNRAPEEKGDFYRDYLGCQVPFLNGGLFEPLENYNWKKSVLHIPDTIFSSKQQTGILDVFDLYNFTVYEDDPVDREVSVDPEMLGKVFENLLPENLRKGQGAYYTPREIVYYMCQESLINYLTTETGIEGKNIRKLIISKDHLFTNDGGFVFSPDETEKLDRAFAGIKVCDPACGSGAFLVGMLHEIVMARRVLNPKKHEYRLKKEAIQGSIYGVDIDPGAVEIAKLRLWLSLVVNYELEDIDPLPNLDYKIICGNSLLEELIIGDEAIRLFDERLLDAGKKKSKVALFDEAGLEGSKGSGRKESLQKRLKEMQKEMLDLNNQGKLTLEIKKELDKKMAEMLKELSPKKKTKVKDYSPGLFAEKAEEYFSQLRELHKQYFFESNFDMKKRIRKQIEQIDFEFIKSSVREKIDSVETRIKNLNLSIPGDRKKKEELMKQNLEYAAIPNRLKESKSKPYFPWKLNFFDVFQEKDGFDVVIANPPYVGEKGHKEIFREIKLSSLGIFHQGKVDLFYFFFHLALNIVKKRGQVTFITTNYYPTATSAKKLRIDFKNRATIRRLINFNELRVFGSALGQHNMITIIEKGQAVEDYADNCITERTGNASSGLLMGILYGKDKGTHYYRVKQEHIYDGEECYIRLGDASVGSNSIMQAIISKIASNKTLLSEICHINLGCHITLSKITKNNLNFKGNFHEGDGVFVLTKKEVEELNLPKEEEKLLKPFIKNSDIHRYYINKSDDKLIYLTWKDNVEKYPNIKKHLLRFRKIFDDQIYRYNEPTWPWFAIHRPREQFLFESLNKIILPYRSKQNAFAYSDFPIYASGDIFFIVPKSSGEYSIKYILALLNSKLYYVWLYHKGKRKGETLELYQKPLSEIPVKKISEIEQKPLIETVDNIISITKAADYLTSLSKQARVKKYEREIDQMVYKLYDLTDDEIKIVEDFHKEKSG